VPEGQDGMAVNHPGTGKTHDLSDLIPESRLIAMDRAVSASWFAAAKLTGKKPFFSVFIKFPAVVTQGMTAVAPAFMIFPAVNVDHVFYCF